MSAGQSLRRGYALVGTTPQVTPRYHWADDVRGVVLIAVLILVILAALSDPVSAAALGRVVGTAWSQAVAVLMHR